MKISTLLFCLSMVLFLGCKDEPEIPEPEFSATIKSTAGDWEANDGALLFFENQDNGVIQLKLTYSQDRKVQKQVHLGVSKVNLEVEEPRAFSIAE